MTQSTFSEQLELAPHAGCRVFSQSSQIHALAETRRANLIATPDPSPASTSSGPADPLAFSCSRRDQRPDCETSARNLPALQAKNALMFRMMHTPSVGCSQKRKRRRCNQSHTYQRRSHSPRTGGANPSAYNQMITTTFAAVLFSPPNNGCRPKRSKERLSSRPCSPERNANKSRALVGTRRVCHSCRPDPGTELASRRVGCGDPEGAWVQAQ